MRHLLILILPLILSSTANAGKERTLLLAGYGGCTVRVMHDALPDAKTGTLIIKSYNLVDGVRQPCGLSAEGVTTSLSEALRYYVTREDLVPATSLFIGRLIHYPWMTATLEQLTIKRGNQADRYREFNEKIYGSSITKPFKKSLQSYQYKVTGTSCEKLLFSSQGRPQDAMCWLLIGPE